MYTFFRKKAATPDDCKYIKINEENGFYTAGLQCGSNLFYNFSNNIYLAFLNMLTSSLHSNLFTMCVLNNVDYTAITQIMAEN